jgi:hypothetical protein
VAQTRNASARSSSSSRRTSNQSDNSRSNGAGPAPLTRVAYPVATAMAGAAAGMALAQRGKRRKKVLGMSIPGTGSSGVGDLAKSVGDASKQLARLADEVSTGRKKAEEIGKALS